MTITITESERSYLVSLLANEINRTGLNTELGRKAKELMTKLGISLEVYPIAFPHSKQSR